jgi:hypothetical protein
VVILDRYDWEEDTTAFFVHPGEAAHGDLGMVTIHRDRIDKSTPCSWCSDGLSAHQSFC